MKVDPKMVQVGDYILPKRGWSSSGSAEEELNRLSRNYGFSWTVNDGVFQAVDDRKCLSGSLVLVNSNSGLMRADPILVSPFQKQAGVSVQTLGNPYIQPGRPIQLLSTVNPQINGIYKIHALTHSGDTHSSQWTTSTETWLVGT